MAKAVPRDERNLFLHTLADFLESSKGPIIFIAGRRKEVSSANNTAAGQFHPLVFLYLFWCVILIILEILIQIGFGYMQKNLLSSMRGASFRV